MVRWEIARWFCDHQAMCLFNCKYHHNLFWFWALTLETQRDALCCFLLDGIILLPITAPTRRDGASLRRAATARSARNGARLLPPTDAIMSSGRLELLNMLNMIRMKSAICLRMRYPRGERASAATVRWSDSRASAWCANDYRQQAEASNYQNTVKYMKIRTIYERVRILYVSSTYLQVFFARYVEIYQLVFDKNTYIIRTNRITDVEGSGTVMATSLVSSELPFWDNSSGGKHKYRAPKKETL